MTNIPELIRKIKERQALEKEGGYTAVLLVELFEKLKEYLTHTKGDKGDHGEAGPTGLQGDPGIDGRDGINGRDGKDGRNGTDGKNGKDGQRGPKGEQGDQGPMGRQGKQGDQGNRGPKGDRGSPDTAPQIREKLESLKGDDRLDASAIKNLPVMRRDLPTISLFGGHGGGSSGGGGVSDHALLTNLAWSVAGHTIDTAFLPDSDNARDIGSDLLRWRDIKASRNAVIGGSITIGDGTADDTRGITFDSVNDAIITWNNTDKILNLRTNGATIFNYPSYPAAWLVNTENKVSAAGLVGFSSWLRQTTVNGGSSELVGYWGGVYDDDVVQARNVGSAIGVYGYNFFGATTTRTITTSTGGIFSNEFGTNVIATTVRGVLLQAIQGGSPTTTTNIAAEIADTTATPTRNYGILIGTMTAGASNWGINTSAPIQLVTTQRLYFGGSATALGINWMARGATTTNVRLAINSAEEYDFDATALSPVTNGGWGIGKNGAGIGDIWFLDTSAAFEDRMLFTSSTVLNADRTLTMDMVNASHILKLTGVSSKTPTSSLFDHFVDANNGTTVETDLYTDTLVASTLSVNGEKVIAHYQGIFTGAAAATQQLKVYFGGTVIYDSGALSIGIATNQWTANVSVIRVSSSVVRCSVWVNSDFATLFPYSKYTEVTGLTLTNTQIIKITGTAAGAGGASNQITAKEGYVRWLPAV